MILIVILALVYVLSLALQMCGAFILMKNICTSPKEIALQLFYKANANYSFDEDGSLDPNTDHFRQEVEDVYKTKVSFFYIFWGFMLSVIGEKPCSYRDHPYIVLAMYIGVFVVSIILYLIGDRISTKKANKVSELYGNRINIKDVIRDKVSFYVDKRKK